VLEGHEIVNSMKSILGAALLAVLAAGCGGLAQPDLGTGQVSGRLTGSFKKGAAFAYAFGAPETKVLVADDGSYTLSQVPVASNGNVRAGQAQIVLFDGDARADIVVADVKPASRTQAGDRDASALARARSVLTAARCSGGASPSNTVYSVDGAALKDDAKGDVARLFPLPPGVFKVRAKLSGFKDSVQDVDLTPEADAQIEMELNLDDGDARKGCISNGCSGDLLCGDDGQCYECTSSDLSKCAAGDACEEHVCVASEGSGNRHACAPCSTDNDCEPRGSLQGKCIPAASGGGSVCSNVCNVANGNADCPSGFACTGGVCVAPGGCSALLQEFGTACFKNDDCAPIADANCFGGHESTAGYCTSRCVDNSDCPSTYSCQSGICLQ
jgi:hypothetical protein